MNDFKKPRMEKSKVVLVLIVSLLAGICRDLYAQSLINNGGFEEFSECPTFPSQLAYCFEWKSPTSSTPDYLNTCNSSFIMPDISPAYAGEAVKGYVGVPENVFGYQKAYKGEAYCGFFLLDWENFDDREYIQAKLNRCLKPEEMVYFSFAISLAERANLNASGITVCFTQGSPKIKKSKSCTDNLSTHKCELLICKNGVYVELGEKVNANAWTEVSGEYTAKGGENFITIGLFKDDLIESDYEVWKKQREMVYRERSKGIYYRYSGAYYYIDDFSVVPVKDYHQDFTHDR